MKPWMFQGGTSQNNYTDAKRLNFTSDLGSAVRKSNLVFICVGTPSKKNRMLLI